MFRSLLSRLRHVAAIGQRAWHAPCPPFAWSKQEAEAWRWTWMPCLALLLLAVAPLASRPAHAFEQSADGVVTLRIGEVGEPLALVAGIDRGFFAAQHLAVKIVPLSGGPALISATIGGSTDLNYGDVFSWAAAVNNGFDVRMIQPSNGGDVARDPAGGWSRLLVNPASGIKSAADLKGRQIAIAPTQLTQLMVRQWLDRNGGDSTTVKFVPVTPYLAMGAALAGGHVDAILDTDPFTQRDQKQYGFVVLGTPSRTTEPGAAIAGYYATADWLAQHGDVARRFVAAYRQSAAWSNAATAEEKAAVLSRFSPLDLNKLQEEVPGLVQDYHYFHFEPGPINVAATQAWIDQAVKYQLLERSIDVAAHLHPTATAASVE